jgi:hypothetical protein
MIKRFIQEDHITIVNVFSPKAGTPSFIRISKIRPNGRSEFDYNIGRPQCPIYIKGYIIQTKSTRKHQR